MATFGEVHDLTTEYNFEWKLDFSSLPEEANKRCKSPRFSFAGEEWYLALSNDKSMVIPVENIGLYLKKATSNYAIDTTLTFSLKTFDGKKNYEIGQISHFYEKTSKQGWGPFQFVKRSKLLEQKSELMPSDILTINLSVQYCSRSDDDGAGNTAETAKCTHCKKTFVVQCLSVHQQKCLDKPIRCPTCKHAVTLEKWFHHECETARIKATEKLVEDLGNLLDDEELSDITIKVKDEEIRLHKSILAARNPYFNSMFKTEMKEKETGIVTIDDCEPDVFRSFISFLYAGKVQELSSDNVCTLYEAADKYQEDLLKAECLDFMKNEMSVDNFCSFIVLALKHEEKELLQTATDLFCIKTREIIQSVQWQTFMREYPTQANELHIKFLDYNDKAKNT